MSAANYYQPHVYIDGVLLNESTPEVDLVAVANFSLKWGGNDWWENIEPAQLDITLLDPQSDLLGTAAQQRIEIRRDPDNTIVFTGTIDSITSTYGRTTDPRTGDPRDMWTHRIIALDPLAQLARDRRRGVTYNARDRDPYRLHWGPCYMGERKDDVSTRSPIPIEWQPTILDQYDDASPVFLFPVPAYERNQVVSLLTVLRNTARISHPLNRPIYFVSENRIKFVSPGSFPNIAYGLAPALNVAGQIVLGMNPNSETQLLPGSQLSLDSGITSGSALREQVTRVEITMRTTRPSSQSTSETDRYMENVENSHEINVVTRAPQQMTVQVESDHTYGYFYEEAANQALLRVAPIIDTTYGAPTFDPIRYRFAKHEPAPAWALPWLTPEPPLLADGYPLPYHLVESLTNWVPGALPFSIVGGTIAYTHKRGWEVTLNTAPRGVINWDPQLGSIVETQTLGNVGDNSLIADWQKLAEA